jgi:hypothetical protein
MKIMISSIYKAAGKRMPLSVLHLGPASPPRDASLQMLLHTEAAEAAIGPGILKNTFF